MLAGSEAAENAPHWPPCRHDEKLIDFSLRQTFETAPAFLGAQRAIALDRGLSAKKSGAAEEIQNESASHRQAVLEAIDHKLHHPADDQAWSLPASRHKGCGMPLAWPWPKRGARCTRSLAISDHVTEKQALQYMKQARQAKLAEAGMAIWKKAGAAVIGNVVELPKAVPRRRRYNPKAA